MEGVLGLLKLRVKRGINLAVRDNKSSDPYVIATLDDQVGFGSTDGLLSGQPDDPKFQKGKLVRSVETRSSAKVLHDMLRYAPNDISFIAPDKQIHACTLLSGHAGAVGSTFIWNFTRDGKEQTTTDLIEEVDEENHKTVFKVIAGELVEEIYKAVKFTFQCEEKDGKKWGIWTMEFEKPNINVPDPTHDHLIMESLCAILKDMDNHASSI